MSKTIQAIEGLKQLVLNGEIRVGERLPPEADLAARLGVSRNVLREAVRALVHGGVLRTRQGDGTYVSELEPNTLLDGVALYSHLATGARLEQVLEARRVIEPELSALATLRLEDDDVARLFELVERMEHAGDERERIDSDIEFHRVVAEGSGNDLLAGILEALTPLTVRPRLWRAVVDTGSVAAQAQQHRTIADAIQARDPEAARAASLVHVADVMRFFATNADVAETDMVPTSS